MPMSEFCFSNVKDICSLIYKTDCTLDIFQGMLRLFIESKRSDGCLLAY